MWVMHGKIIKATQSNIHRNQRKSMKIDTKSKKMQDNYTKNNETLRNLHNSKENQGIPTKTKNIIRNLKKSKKTIKIKEHLSKSAKT